MKQTQRAVAQYEQLEGQRSGFQITFALIFMTVAMLFFGRGLAIRHHLRDPLGGPIASLIAAAERVRGGDLAVRVPEGRQTTRWPR